MAEDLAQGHADEPEEGAGVVAAGWRPDPHDRFRYRWWDGGAWTAYATDGGAAQWDPTPINPAITHDPGLPGIGVAFFAYVLAVLAAFAVHAFVDASAATELVLSSLALWTVLLGAALFVSARRGTGSFITDYGLRFRWIDIGFGIAASLVARVLAGFAVSPIPLSQPRRGNGPSIFDGQNSSTVWIILIVVVCIGAPLVEEVFFRGLLQRRLVGRAGPVPGIAVASVLFGSAHLIAWSGPISLAYAWGIAAGALVFGATYHVSGRLGTAIATHAAFNAQALIAIALLR